jgi:hypothetical protein
MHFIFNRYRRYRPISQSNIILSLPVLFPYPDLDFSFTSDLLNENRLSPHDGHHVINFELLFCSYSLLSSSKLPIDPLMHPNRVQVVANMNVCNKHLFYPLMKKVTFHYQHENIKVNIFFLNMYSFDCIYSRYSLSRWYFRYRFSR